MYNSGWFDSNLRKMGLEAQFSFIPFVDFYNKLKIDVDIRKHRVPKYVNRRKLIIFVNGNKTRDGSIPSARMVGQGSAILDFHICWLF